MENKFTRIDFDGAKARKALEGAQTVPAADLATSHVSGLAKPVLGVSAPPSAPKGKVTPLPREPMPTPLIDKIDDAIYNALDYLRTKLVRGSDRPPSRIAAPLAPAAVEPLETTDGILVRAPRARSFDALGYRVDFAPPSGFEATPAREHAARVRVQRGADRVKTAELAQRFEAFNALIEDNFAALELLAQNPSTMTVKTARQVLARIESMAEAYARMIGPIRAAEATAGIPVLAREFAAATRGLSDGDVLPPNAAALVIPLEDGTMHEFVNRLHQEALSEIGRKDAGASANMTVAVGDGRAERSVRLTDLSERRLVAGGRILSPAFKALVEAMRRSKDDPIGTLILQDHQFWGHFALGSHSAEVYANFLPADEGGMIRVRYQEWGDGYDNKTRLYYIARILQKTGFHVVQDNGLLNAVVDKDHAAQTPDQMTDTFALVVQALHATVGVDFALPLLVQGTKTSAEAGARIDQWVDVVLGEGTLPFYVNDAHSKMIRGWSDYQADAREREDLRTALNRTLARLGISEIPSAETMGQRTIDRFFNAPIEEAIARGQLRVTTSGDVESVPGYDPLLELGRRMPRETAAAARMAEVVSSLDPGLFRFTAVGSLGALTVERAERRLEPDSIVVLYALRDPISGQVGFAEAWTSDLRPDSLPRRLGTAELFARLGEQGYAVAPFEPSDRPAGLEHFVELLSSPPAPDRALGRRTQGLAASPAHGRPVLARVTYDKEKAARGGFIFVAPYTTPDDLEAIRHSKAVITTSGGLLSHASITTREMGIPAAILPRAEWSAIGAAFESPQFERPWNADGVVARSALSSARAPLPENALVRLDPATGVVEIYSESVAVPLLAAQRALERYDATQDGRSLERWLKTRLGDAGMPRDQKRILAREVLDGLATRALARPEAAAELAALYGALPRSDGYLRSAIEETADALLDDALRSAAALLGEQKAAVDQAVSVEAVERAARAGEARAVRAAAIAEALRRPASRLTETTAAAAALAKQASSRARALLAADVAELSAHALEVPNATVEVLPRLKAAIAKGRRRGLDPAVLAVWEKRAAELEARRETAMRAAAPIALPLSSVLDMDAPRVGGKGAKLGEIAQIVALAGGEVPPGLALTADAYREFLRETGIAERLEHFAADERLSPEERAERARRLILGAPLTADAGVGRAIIEALRAQHLDGAMLAVRSSAVDEDGAEAAFAGAGDTHLYVSAEDLLPHVREIWASLWNPRALLYRRTKGLTTTHLAQAVVVQAMVDSEVSGVAFTADPVTGDTSRPIVNAAFGLGEGVVSGRVAPDQYVVGKALGREILPPMIADKKLAILRAADGRGTAERRMPAQWRRRRAMTPVKLELLNTVARSLENHFGYPLDIEYAFVENKLYILQARPVTNAPVAEPAPEPTAATAHEGARLMFVCTGNTCRSPMAERLAKDALAREGLPHFEVLSRGLAVAESGEPISAHARAALRAVGSNGDGHFALALETSDAIWADVILTMTRAQADELLRRYPGAKGKVFTLGEYSGVGGDIADPYGSDAGAYRATAAQISAAVDAAVDRAASAAPASR
jgi:protein-tyrosine-phosphatase/phosphohistidine swiveling domain-containing protein